MTIFTLNWADGSWSSHSCSFLREVSYFLRNEEGLSVIAQCQTEQPMLVQISRDFGTDFVTVVLKASHPACMVAVIVLCLTEHFCPQVVPSASLQPPPGPALEHLSHLAAVCYKQRWLHGRTWSGSCLAVGVATGVDCLWKGLWLGGLLVCFFFLVGKECQLSQSVISESGTQATLSLFYWNFDQISAWQARFWEFCIISIFFSQKPSDISDCISVCTISVSLKTVNGLPLSSFCLHCVLNQNSQLGAILWCNAPSLLANDRKFL